jgi:hypothetical protein
MIGVMGDCKAKSVSARFTIDLGRFRAFAGTTADGHSLWGADVAVGFAEMRLSMATTVIAITARTKPVRVARPLCATILPPFGSRTITAPSAASKYFVVVEPKLPHPRANKLEIFAVDEVGVLISLRSCRPKNTQSK